MPANYSEPGFPTEPMRRFYPPQGAHPLPQKQMPKQRYSPRQTESDAAYLMHRHPILLQRLYHAADTLLTMYPERSFLYDAYPDYQSLRLMRDRLLRENNSLTEEFLRSGCPIEWLNLLADTVISELLCRLRTSYRKPRGDANTTSVQSAFRS